MLPTCDRLSVYLNAHVFEICQQDTTFLTEIFIGINALHLQFLYLGEVCMLIAAFAGEKGHNHHDLRNFTFS